MKVLFITGEASGDSHASNLINSLRKINPDIKFYGIGGKKMEKAGVKIIYPSDKIAVIGFSEVFSKISNLKEARRQISTCIKENKFDFAVTVDFPGFNISIARTLKNMGIPIFYFITPQVWAWGKWRSKSLSKYFKGLFVIYPFEKSFFDKEGIKSFFLGNPLLDIVKSEGKLKIKDLPSGNPLIAILPGSRETEIKRLLLPILKAFRIFKEKHPGSKAVIALHEEKDLSMTQEIGKELLNGIEIFHGRTYDIINCSDLAVVSSGTATIEAGILQTPMVIVYKLSYISWIISKILARVKHFGLVNILFSERIVPELIQKEVNPKRIAKELEMVYEKRENISKQLKKLKPLLGSEGVYDRIANKILSMV
ncbi:lipid-A-disaccharide synthase [candidate division WOR-3 bacterium]|nr:lipid-A-disaccharide synthase [candidate division WOR-3 bacterium]